MRIQFVIEVENSPAEVEALEREYNCSIEEMIELLTDPASAENHGLRQEFASILGDYVKVVRVKQIS